MGDSADKCQQPLDLPTNSSTASNSTATAGMHSPAGVKYGVGTIGDELSSLFHTVVGPVVAQVAPAAASPTPTCTECISRPECGWCSSSNRCNNSYYITRPPVTMPPACTIKHTACIMHHTAYSVHHASYSMHLASYTSSILHAHRPSCIIHLIHLASCTSSILHHAPHPSCSMQLPRLRLQSVGPSYRLYGQQRITPIHPAQR
jgi:hypothetical protein